MAACDLIGYFISPVLWDLHVLSLCFAIPSPYLVVRTQSVCFFSALPLSFYSTRMQGRVSRGLEDGHNLWPLVPLGPDEGVSVLTYITVRGEQPHHSTSRDRRTLLQNSLSSDPRYPWGFLG
jgi:hypothetical protein